MTPDFAAHMEAVARRLLGEPNLALSSPTQWRYGTRGSLSVEVGGDRCGTWYDHEREEGGGVLDLIHRQIGLVDGAAVAWMARELGIHLNGRPPAPGERPIVATYDYRDETGALLFEVVRYGPKDFRQRRPDGQGGREWSVRGARQVPYRLPELLKRPEGVPIYIVEGEKDVDRLAALGVAATTNAGGAGKWRSALNEHLRGAVVYVLPDADDAGRAHAEKVAAGLHGIAAEVRIVHLPGLALKEDVSDWLDRGGTADALATICAAAPPWTPGDAALVPHDIEDLDQGEIPPRQWLLSTVLCRRYLTVLAASGGAGKTTLLLAWALSLASGRALVGDSIHRRSRVLILAFEDDVDEYRRRLRAARLHHDVGAVGSGWCHVVSLAGLGITLATAGKDGTLTATGAAEQIIALIRRLRSDVVIFDPYVKLADGNENDNRAADFVARILVRIAIDTDTALLVAHHTRKGPADAGNIDAARGARAIIDAARLALTLTPMSSVEAKTFNIAEDERRHLIRLDDGKVNLTPAAGSTRWYRLASVDIRNANKDYPSGDRVQAITRWEPPDFWRDLGPALVNRILDEIDAGLNNGERYSNHNRATDRAVWPVVLRHAPTLSENQARQAVATWVEKSVLEERDYHSPKDRRDVKGLFVIAANRPGERFG